MHVNKPFSPRQYIEKPKNQNNKNQKVLMSKTVNTINISETTHFLSLTYRVDIIQDPCLYIDKCLLFRHNNGKMDNDQSTGTL